MGGESNVTQVFPDGKSLILAVDHDFNIATGQSGVPNLTDHLSAAAHSGVDAVLAHRDVFADPTHGAQLAGLKKILQVNAAGQETDARALVYDDLDKMTEEAASFDARMLGFQVNFGSEYEVKTLRDLERVSKAAAGLPLFIHTYLRRQGDTFNHLSAEEYGNRIDAAIETVAALGAQVVKLAFRDGQTFGRAIETAHRLGMHIVAAGGSKTSTTELFSKVGTVMGLGANGLTVGRNAFDRPVDEEIMILKTLTSVVHPGS